MNTRTRVEPKGENFSGALAAPAGSVLVLVTKLVPARMLWRLKDFGNGMSIVANWGKIRWDFYVNGVLLYPFNAVRDQIGFLGGRQPISEKEIAGGSLFEIIVTQESGIADPVVGCSLGWEEESRV